MFGHELGMLSKAIVGALDLHDDDMVQLPIKERSGDDGIAEHLVPFGKVAVGGEDHGASLAAGIYQL